MHAEIVAIGTELLLGELVDTNSATIAKKLQGIGLPLHYTSTVGDNLDRIVSVLRQGLARSTVLITTGGLGPTVDDMTREGMARATGRPLVFDEALLRQIEDRFKKWGRTMTDNNRQQAYRPEGSVVIENPVGTAPCFIVDQGDRIALCLPGVPREMEFLMDSAVLPFLRRRLNLSGVIKSRELKVSGAGESVVDEKVGDLERLENPIVGLNAKSGIILIRITATAADTAAADRLIADVEQTARARLGDLIFGADSDTLEGVVLDRLRQQGQTLAAVEAGTGGRLSGKLAGAAAQARPAVFLGGSLKVLEGSEEPAALAEAAAREATADWGIASIVSRSEGNLSVAVGVWGPTGSSQWRRGFGSHPGLAPEWSANMPLDSLRQQLK